MAVILTGNRRHINLRMWQGVIVLTVAAGTTVWLVKHPSQIAGLLRFLPWLTAAIMLLKTYGTWRAFRAVTPLVSRRDLRVLAGLWTLVALLVLAAGVFAHITRGLPAAILWTLVLWQFFPSGEIPQCVVSLDSNRHR